MTVPQSAIEFWFDFSSPYSYIASEWIEALAARHGRTVRWNAILLGVTFQAAELRSPVDHPIKRDYTLHDFERSARYAGVPYSLPDPFPIPTQNAARVFWWLADEQPATAAAWARHCLRAYFTRNVNLADVSQLKALAVEFGIDGEVAEGVWTSPEAKARLRRVCDDAVAHGVFGAPFFVVDGEPFWGNDRRGQIERWLQGGSFQVTAHGDL
jgi:2-hydroxychromene-2-carboxylate isomerase